MATEIVASFTIVIVKGGVYQKTFTITDENGVAILLNSAQIDVTPNGAAGFSWTAANGKLVNSGTGIYNLALTAVDTAAYLWTSGTYVMAVEDSSGDANPCLISGKIFAKDC